MKLDNLRRRWEKVRPCPGCRALETLTDEEIDTRIAALLAEAQGEAVEGILLLPAHARLCPNTPKPMSEEQLDKRIDELLHKVY